MSKAPASTDATAEQTAAERGQSLVRLDAVEAAGASRFGVRVRVMILEMEDGRRVRLELPTDGPPATPSVKDWTRTKPGRAVLTTMAKEQRPLKGETIAKLADYAYNGSFREALRGLEVQGEIRKADDDSGYVLSE